MSKHVVVMTCAGTVDPGVMATLDPGRFKFRQVPDGLPRDELIASLKDAEAIYHGGDDFLSREILTRLPRLRLLAFGGTGYESFIDVEAASELGILITNTPEANSDSVAEFAVGLLLSLQRRIVRSANEMREGIHDRTVSRQVRGRKVGIIGMGAIGSRLARLMTSFGAIVSYHNRTRRPEREKELGIAYCSLEELLAGSDIVFIAITGNATTRDYLGSKELSLMRSDALLVNPASPSLINASALLDCLRERRLGGCAMDGVHEGKEAAGLLELDDDVFICTADLACRTTDAWDATDRIALDNILAFFDGKTPPNVVNDRSSRE